MYMTYSLHTISADAQKAVKLKASLVRAHPVKSFVMYIQTHNTNMKSVSLYDTSPVDCNDCVNVDAPPLSIHLMTSFS